MPAAVGPRRGGVQLAHQLPRGLRVLDQAATGRVDGDLELRQVHGWERLAQPPAVGVRRRRHPTVPLGREGPQLRHQPARVVEEPLGRVGPQPLLQHPQVFRVVRDAGQRHLVGPEGALHLDTVHDVGAGPALGRAQHDGRPGDAGLPGWSAPGPGGGLEAADLVLGVAQGGVQSGEHLGRVVAGHRHRRPALGSQVALDLLVAAPAEDGGTGDLVAVEVQDRQHRPVASRVEEGRHPPRTRERAGLGLAVADHAGHGQVGVVERRAGRVDEGVPELAALVDAARRLHADVAGDAAGRGELAEERPDAVGVVTDVRIDLGVCALQPGGRHQGGAAVAGAGDVEPVGVGLTDHAVEQGVEHRQPGAGAPVPQQPRLDVVECQRVTQQHVLPQVDLADGEVVGRRPPAQIEVELDGVVRRGGERGGGRRTRCVVGHGDHVTTAGCRGPALSHVGPRALPPSRETARSGVTTRITAMTRWAGVGSLDHLCCSSGIHVSILMERLERASEPQVR